MNSDASSIKKEKLRRIYFTVKIVFTIIGVVSGITICACFGAHKNINAAIWGLLSAVFAAIMVRLLIAHKRRTIATKYTLERIRSLKYIGAFGSLAAIIAAITYFTLTTVYKQGYKMEGDGYMPAGIFSLLTLKWTAILFCSCRRYEKTYFDDEEMITANGGSA